MSLDGFAMLRVWGLCRDQTLDCDKESSGRTGRSATMHEHYKQSYACMTARREPHTPDQFCNLSPVDLMSRGRAMSDRRRRFCRIYFCRCHRLPFPPFPSSSVFIASAATASKPPLYPPSLPLPPLPPPLPSPRFISATSFGLSSYITRTLQIFRDL